MAIRLPLRGNQASLSANQGVLLTTGFASAAGTPNSDGIPGSTSGNNNASGSPLIDNSNNGATLSVRFTSNITVASFSYLFASAEYQGIVNSQSNDAFGFLFNGQNIAKVPGTNLTSRSTT